MKLTRYLTNWLMSLSRVHALRAHCWCTLWRPVWPALWCKHNIYTLATAVWHICSTFVVTGRTFRRNGRCINCAWRERDHCTRGIGHCSNVLKWFLTLDQSYLPWILSWKFFTMSAARECLSGWVTVTRSSKLSLRCNARPLLCTDKVASDARFAAAGPPVNGGNSVRWKDCW